eukprot:m51a1_g1261 hypothetical protein (329) ;mRNA; r:53803-55253
MRALYGSVVAVVALLAGAEMASGARAGRRWLNVLHTADVHSELLPLSAAGGPCRSPCAPVGTPCFGGVARLLRKEAEERGEAVLFVDAGGFSQYDAMTLGTHDFDDGPESASAFAATLETGFVLSNVDFTKEERFTSSIQPYIIKTFRSHDLKVAIVGVITQDVKFMSSPGDRIRVGDPIAALKAIVPKLFDKDIQIAQSVDNITLIVGGHDGTLLRNAPLLPLFKTHGKYPLTENGPSGFPVPIVYAGSMGQFLGHIRMEIALVAHAPAQWSGDTTLIDSKTRQDPRTEDALQKMSELMWSLREDYLPGRAADDLEGRPSRARMWPS